MRAKQVNEKFTEGGDPVKQMGIGLKFDMKKPIDYQKLFKQGFLKYLKKASIDTSTPEKCWALYNQMCDYYASSELKSSSFEDEEDKILQQILGADNMNEVDDDILEACSEFSADVFGEVSSVIAEDTQTKFEKGDFSGFEDEEETWNSLEDEDEKTEYIHELIDGEAYSHYHVMFSLLCGYYPDHFETDLKSYCKSLIKEIITKDVVIINKMGAKKFLKAKSIPAKDIIGIIDDLGFEEFFNSYIEYEPTPIGFFKNLVENILF